MQWVATVLAAALAVATPVTARLAGERTAEPRPQVLTIAAPAYAAHPLIERSRPAGTTVLGEHASRPPASRLDRPTVPKVARGVHLLVRAVPALVARRNPWPSAPAVGRVASVSRYYGVPIVLWVEATNAKETWGRVELPYVFPRREGWIRLRGIPRDETLVTVTVDLSEREVRVWKNGELRYHVAGAIGAPSSPTPPGKYFVTDRVPFAASSAYGSFAFGISGTQPRLPPGWSGGDQLAIHGTNEPWTIGTAASAGCIRVSAWALSRFKPLLRLGTPVIVTP
jgi:lipoprotein-anchoring transpeptidase ErfK/SrfK